MSRIGKSTVTEGRLVVVRGCGERGMGSDHVMDKEFLLRVMKMFGN